MPLVRVDLNRGRSPKELHQLLDIIHAVMVASFHVPARDRYQIVHQHGPGELVIEDTGLGYTRSDRVVILSLVSRERTVTQLRTFYRELAKQLAAAGLVAPDDLVINVSINTDQGWSFGRGHAEFIDGPL
ncbi:tautomerase family protein [Lacticaseibacillus sp. GG6-2]